MPEDIIKDLKLWRKQRGISTDMAKDGYVLNIIEELAELREAIRLDDDNAFIDAICDIAVFTINTQNSEKLYQGISIWSIVYNRIDTEAFAENLFIVLGEYILLDYKDKTFWKLLGMFENIAKLKGYDFDECMRETIKEISSRTGKFDKSLKKWVKDEIQLNLYKADYDRCKIWK